ncbi:hypothetical protein PQR05_00020 [Paraburkholderia sediminicola]|uniref:hypothetical protein n=1 Tax=Paraburkholderia sediminicola TaxID=458836 RepID=UPI0038B6DFB8
MTIALLSFSRLCFVWCAFYLALSLQSAVWASKRHGSKTLFLEIQSYRASGKREKARAKLLRRVALGAIIAMPVGLACWLVAVVKGA